MMLRQPKLLLDELGLAERRKALFLQNIILNFARHSSIREDFRVSLNS